MTVDYDSEEFVDIALNCIFPSSEEIEPDILKEITVFLEESENHVSPEDAEIVRGEVRKALIHFKNRPYLYNTRKKMEKLLKSNDNWKRFIVAPSSFVSEFREAGLNNEEIDLLRISLKTARTSYNAMKNIPLPRVV
ncbi:MAG: hypothetical protein GOP50_13310 [Candidatus Heimdallarchaeota archaeon]|nr:hypothetical protein [Candidatus Heimdallarchaeota archaeon]